ncbi:Acyl-CoA-binding domain-containing protein 6 [Aix galericulata]|nr:Acyl-CoA-binding domain-containing protein 6 [Aix galericulata]
MLEGTSIPVCPEMHPAFLDGVGSRDATTEKRGKESKTAFGGPVVSSLYQEETIREEDKNIFDYCKENNIDYVTKAIQSKKVDVNVADEEGRALLHWACDRGHKELVSVLLQHAADVNSQVIKENFYKGSGFALPCHKRLAGSSYHRLHSHANTLVSQRASGDRDVEWLSPRTVAFSSLCEDAFGRLLEIGVDRNPWGRDLAIRKLCSSL